MKFNLKHQITREYGIICPPGRWDNMSERLSLERRNILHYCLKDFFFSQTREVLCIQILGVDLLVNVFLS
jgi:hypothetical protein